MEALKKILVVDDEKTICMSISKILTKRDYYVDTSYDADQALTKIEKIPYNLVLLDIMMPKISGMGLLKTIRTQYKECNVVMITGYPSIETAVKATQMGALDYIPKPFTPEELLKVVQRVFTLKEAKLKKAESDVKDTKIKKIAPDFPYDYDEVAAATSEMYARTVSNSDIPIIGWQRHYEQNNNILVVDDEVVVCNSVRKILTKSGYSVDYANSTEEAVSILKKKRYGLVLLDLRLPSQGGITLLRQIRKSWPLVKIIIITGYASIDSAIETAKLGASSYIPKPFSPDELNGAVKEALQYAA